MPDQTECSTVSEVCKCLIMRTVDLHGLTFISGLMPGECPRLYQLVVPYSSGYLLVISYF